METAGVNNDDSGNYKEIPKKQGVSRAKYNSRHPFLNLLALMSKLKLAGINMEKEIPRDSINLYDDVNIDN